MRHAGPGTRAGTREALVRRATLLLALAQSCLWGAVATFAAFGAIAMKELTGREGGAAVLFGVYYLAAAGGAVVAGRLMDRAGRRPGLVAGYLVMATSGGVMFAAVSSGSGLGVLAGGTVIGLGAAAALLGRGAVAEMHPPEHRGRAVGILVLAGTVGAVGGPPLASALYAAARRLGAADPLAVPFLAVSALAATGAVAVGLLRPDPRQLAVGRPGPEAAASRPGRVLRRRPAAVAVAAIGVVQIIMVTYMAAVPAALHGHGAAALTVSLVVSAHFAGMFAFSPVLGAVIDRAGRRTGLLLGLALSGAGVALTLAGEGTFPAGGGLLLVGIGWSAAYLASTAVVSDLAGHGGRATALGTMDLVAAVAAGSGVLAGAIVLEGGGFVVLGAAALVLLLLPLALVLPLREPASGGWGSPPHGGPPV